MTCPLFIDFTRDCLTKIKHIPRDTFDFCTTERYSECPFFRTINNIGEHCEFIENCVIYARFAVGDFNEFVSMTKAYCLTCENVNCKRYQIRKSGQKPSPDLLPDGSLLK